MVGKARAQGLRVRTTAAATLTLLPLLVAAGATGVVLQRHNLTASVVQLATDQAHAVVSEVATGDTPELAGGEDVVQVIRDGAVVITSGPRRPLSNAPSDDAPVIGKIDGATLGESDRYVTVALVADPTTYVVVARSIESVDAATTSTATLLAAGGLLVLVATCALTWITTGRALSPVETMRARAASIPTDQLDLRLPVPDTDDEVARLATTLNAFLDRVEAATRAQRQFVADASHELRSPVATIRALVETDLIRPHPGGREGLADEVLTETSQLGDLVDDLLVLARTDARAPRRDQPVDLSALVRTETRRNDRAHLPLAVEDDLHVVGDPAELTRLLRNLLDNAERHGDGIVAVSARAAVGQVQLEVTDAGAGIAAADRERIFERFVRLDRARTRNVGGTGLGLALVREIAAQHGGTVSVVDAEPGAEHPGARFIVRLPERQE